MLRLKYELRERLKSQFTNAPDSDLADKRFKKEVVLGYKRFSQTEVDLAEQFFEAHRLGNDLEEAFEIMISSVEALRAAKTEDEERGKWKDKTFMHTEYYDLEELGFDPSEIEGYISEDLEKAFIKMVEEHQEDVDIEKFDDDLEAPAEMWKDFFTRSVTVFNLEGEIVSQKVYDYEFRPSLLPQLKAVDDFEEYVHMLELVFGKKETVVKERPERHHKIELHSGLLFGKEEPSEENFLAFIRRYFSYRFLLNELNQEALDRKALEDGKALGTPSQKLKWKGNQNLLDSLIYTLHDAGYLEGEKVNTFRAFDAIFEGSNMEKQSSRLVNNFVKVKDGAAHTRFNAFLDELKASFEEYMKMSRKRI